MPPRPNDLIAADSAAAAKKANRLGKTARRAMIIYRKCDCRETAFDYSPNDPLWTSGHIVYRCRNCRAARVLKLEAAS